MKPVFSGMIRPVSTLRVEIFGGYEAGLPAADSR